MQVGASIARRFVLVAEEPYDLEGVRRFVGQDTRLERPVTIDIVTSLAPSAVVDAAGRARVLRDKRLARVLAAGRERDGNDRYAYIVTERPTGVHLEDLLGRVVFVPRAAAAVVGEAAAALQTASLAGEHHGLIRPRALSVTESGRVIVSGMGLDGELGVQSGKARGRGERTDAVALAQVYLTAITGLAAESVTVADLPDDLSPAALKLAKAAIKGSGPKTLADVTTALGVGDTAVLRGMAHEAPSLWWPVAPAVVAPVEAVVEAPVVDAAPAAPAPAVAAAVVAPPKADEPAVAEPVVDEAVVVESEPAPGELEDATIELPPVTDEIAVVATPHLQPEDVVDGELMSTDLAAPVADDVVDAEIVRTDEIPVPRPLTRFGGAVDDIDEFHDIVTDQNQEERPTVVEATMLWLRERFPDSEPIARASEAAHRRANTQAPINAGPLLVGLAITAVVIVAVMAMSTVGEPYDPDFDRHNNPENTYPAYTFGVEPSPSADAG